VTILDTGFQKRLTAPSTKTVTIARNDREEQLAAHHGWGEYDCKKPITLTGTIKASGYENPHSFVDLDVNGKMWHARKRSSRRNHNNPNKRTSSRVNNDAP